MQISLFGLTLFSANKGCEALCYSFLDMLSKYNEKYKKKITVYIHMILMKNVTTPAIPNLWPNLNIKLNRIGLKNIQDRRNLFKIICTSDYCFDFTEGDSFSDIYGMHRFATQTLIKNYIIFKHKKLILGPQTYGPFDRKVSRLWAGHIIKRAYKVFSRDDESAEFIKKNFSREIEIATDIAMGLNPVINRVLDDNTIKLGINVSGLLYNGGYTGDNQFGLTVDYKEYIDKITDYFANNHKYTVFLIPHVITDDFDDCENDLKICMLLKSKYSNVQVVEDYSNPAIIKGYISQMDVFTGARMHSTVAAFSTKVPVIPFAYSKKFNGLYGNLGYEFVIDGKKLCTLDAVKRTIHYIENKDQLLDSISKGNNNIKQRMDIFKVYMEKELFGGGC